MACLDFYATLESSKVIAKDSFCTLRLFDLACGWMPEPPHNNATCTSPGYMNIYICIYTYQKYCVWSRDRGRGQVITSHRYCKMLLLVSALDTCYHSLHCKKTTISHLSWFLILVTCRWTCITTGVLLTPNDALKLNPFSQEKITKHQRKKIKTKRYHLL